MNCTDGSQRNICAGADCTSSSSACEILEDCLQAPGGQSLCISKAACK